MINYLLSILYSIILGIAVARCFFMVNYIDLISYNVRVSPDSSETVILICFFLLIFFLVGKKIMDRTGLAATEVCVRSNKAGLPLLLLVPELFFQVQIYSVILLIAVFMLVVLRNLCVFNVSWNFFPAVRERTAWFIVGTVFLLLVIHGWFLQKYAVRTLTLSWTDWGYIWEAMDNTLKGQFFFSNYLGLNHLKIHFSPILLALAPVVWWGPAPDAFFLMSSFFLFSGGLCLYWLARTIGLSTTESMIFAFIYFFIPGITNMNVAIFYSFHEAYLFMSCAFLGVICYEKKHYWLAAILFILSLLIKETEAVFWVGLGFVALWGRHRKAGLTTMIFALIYFIAVLGFLLPAINHGAYSQGFRYQHLGNSNLEILFSPVLRSSEFWSSLFRSGNFYFVGLLILPFFLLLGFRPFILAAAVPILLFICLQQSNQLQNIYMQYQCSPLTVFCLAALYGYRHYRENNNALWSKLLLAGTGNDRNAPPMKFLVCAGLTTLLCWLFFAQTHVSKNNIVKFMGNIDYTPAVDEFKSLIPENVPLNISLRLAPHFCGRNTLYFNGPNRVECDYVLLDLKDRMFGKKDLVFRDELLKSGKFFPVKWIDADSHLFVLFKKNAEVKEVDRNNIIIRPDQRKINLLIDIPVNDDTVTGKAIEIDEGQILFFVGVKKKIDYDIDVKVIINDQIMFHSVFGNGIFPAFTTIPGEFFYFRVKISPNVGEIKNIKIDIEKIP